MVSDLFNVDSTDWWNQYRKEKIERYKARESWFKRRGHISADGNPGPLYGGKSQYEFPLEKTLRWMRFVVRRLNKAEWLELHVDEPKFWYNGISAPIFLWRIVVDAEGLHDNSFRAGEKWLYPVKDVFGDQPEALKVLWLYRVYFTGNGRYLFIKKDDSRAPALEALSSEIKKTDSFSRDCESLKSDLSDGKRIDTTIRNFRRWALR